MTALRHLDAALGELRASGLLRTGRTPLPAGTLVLCSNDYLGYASEPIELGPDELATLPSGAGASRLVAGDDGEHRRLEQALADWVGCEAALLFGSGYAANVGTLAALCAEGDLIVSDALDHASIIDGCRLSRAHVAVVAHADAGAVERALGQGGAARRRWVVTESYFSMDGDSPDLEALRAICDRYDAALLVDEAHALGVFGPEGRGLCAARGVRPDVLVGTLGKAVGMQGAFVAGSRALCAWLYNRARSLVFSTAPSPVLTAATRRRIERVRRDDAARQRLHAIAARVRRELALGAACVRPSHGPIIPWDCASAAAACDASAWLLARGLFVHPIRPPTVAKGSARLRVTLHARLDDGAVDRVVAVLGELASRLGSQGATPGRAGS